MMEFPANFNFQPKMLVSQAYEFLLESIISGKLKEGERIIEADVVEALNISRQPVRDALHMLKAAGFVELIPYRGAVVSSLTADDVQETLQIKAMVEGFAAWTGAHKFSEADIDALDRMLDEMERYIGEDNLAEVVRYNDAFHRSMVVLTSLKKLIKLYESLYLAVRRMQAIGLNNRITWKESLKEHRRIVEALRKRKARESEDSARQHGLNSIERVMAELKLKRGENDG